MFPTICLIPEIMENDSALRGDVSESPVVPPNQERSFSQRQEKANEP